MSSADQGDVALEEYRVERFALGHLPAVMQLHEAVYGPPSSTERERQRRKFDTSDLGHDVIGFVAYDSQGLAAGFYGVFPLIVESNGRQLLAAQSGDTMTHPDHRGRGLFKLLGQATNDLARQEGVAFIFGFPNGNSYPGFIKYMDWRHERTMRSYWRPIPTLPLAYLRRGSSSRFESITRWQRRMVLSIRLAERCVALESSILMQGGSGVSRNTAFHRYKGDDLLEFNQSGVRVVFRLDDAIRVGDVIAQEYADIRPALARLSLIAALTGRHLIRFHTSPGSVSDRLVSGHMRARDGVPYGHVVLADGPDPDRFDFTYVDYDTF